MGAAHFPKRSLLLLCPPALHGEELSAGPEQRVRPRRGGTAGPEEGVELDRTPAGGGDMQQGPSKREIPKKKQRNGKTAQKMEKKINIAILQKIANFKDVGLC